MPYCLPSAHRCSPLISRHARPATGRVFIAMLLFVLLFVSPAPAAAQTPPGADSALHFDGVDDYVEIPYDEDLRFGSGDFTVEFWVQRLNAGARTDLFALNDEAGKALTIYIQADNRVRFDTWEGSVDSSLTSTATVGTGWTHIAFVREAKKMSIYINGRLSGSSSSTLRNFESNSSIRIGKLFREDNFWLRGAMDELRVWRTARTQSEILQNMYRTLAVPQTNLIAYYTFNQSGTDASLTDSSGNGHHGELMTQFTFAPSPWRLSGAFQGPDNALRFDGSNDFVSIVESSQLQPEAYTLEAWVNCSRFTSSRQTILIKGSPGPYQLAIEPVTRNVSFSLPNSPSSQTIISETSLVTGRWYHLAATYSDGTMKLYVDGVLQASLTGAVTPVTNSKPLTIGGSSITGAGYFEGSIDEVRIWSRARTADEIRETMARSLTGSEPNLAAYYRFDQAVVTNVDDPDALTIYDWGPLASHGRFGQGFTVNDSVWPTSTAFNAWIGGVSSDWTGATNWSRNAVPASTDTVGVPGGSAFSPTISANASLRTLVIGSSAALTAAGSPTLTIGGHWFNQGTFTPASSTVVLSGSNQSLAGSTTFHNLTKTITSADTLIFSAGETQTVTGTLTLKGTAETKRLALRSSQPGVQWKIDPRGGRDLDYLDVQDSHNINAATIIVGESDILDNGNNTGWAFGSPPVITEGESVSVVMSEDGDPIPFSLTLNATDPDGDALTWSLATPPLQGTAEAAGTGEQLAVGYIPNNGYLGEDSFVVTVSDNRHGSDSITVNVTIQAVDDPPVLTIPPGALNYTENDGTVLVAPNLTLTDPDGPNLTGVKVSIENYHPGEDFLVYPLTNGVSGSFDAGTGILELTGDRSVSDYQAALRTVGYRNASETPSTEPRTVAFAITQASLYFPVTEHFYEFVPEAGIHWTDARARAEDRAKYGQPGYPSGVYGLQGYLATITSAEENAFLTEKVSGTAWIGASDEAVEGVWRWVTGPEAGTQFWQGLGSSAGGYAVNSAYTNWNGTGEPNDSSGEDYAHMLSNPVAGEWNDLPNPGGTRDYASTGYMVEYGGMADDPFLSLSGEVTVNVTAVNDPPIFDGSSQRTLNEDDSHSLDLAPLFSDSEGDPITFVIKTGPANGSASIVDEILTYTPDPNYNGEDSLTITASDGQGGALDVTFNYTITAVNDAPTSANKTVTTDEDTPYAFAPAEFPFADVDAGDMLDSVQITTLPEFGSLTLNGTTVSAGDSIAVADLDAGRLVFQPAANANGAGYATFDFRVSDGYDFSGDHTLTIDVTPLNDPPVFSGSTSITLQEDGYKDVDLAAHFSDVDGDSLTYEITTGPTNGSAAIDGATLTYTPDSDYHGSDSLTITAADNNGGSLPVDLTFTVTAFNDAPELLLGEYALPGIAEDVIDANNPGLTISSLLSDDVGEVDGEAVGLAVTEADNTHGAWQYFDGSAWQAVDEAGTPAPASALLLPPAAKLRFVPAANFHGAATLSARAWDQTTGTAYGRADVTTNGGSTAFSSAQATVVIAVSAVNDAPVFSGDNPMTVALDEDSAYTSVDLLSLFSDADGDPLSIEITSEPANGSASLSTEVIAGGLVLVYTPNANFNGGDSLTITASDDKGGLLPVVFNFTVASVNDAPTSEPNTVTTDEDTPYIFALTDFPFADVDAGDSLQSIRITNLPDAGSLTVDGAPVSADDIISAADLNAGRLVFQPDANANGLGYATFDFRVSDGDAFSSAHTLTIDVTPVNDAPEISGTPAVTVAAESPYSFTPTASDVDGDPLTFSIANQPAWASFDPASGALTGTPANADVGTTSGIVISVSDGQGGAASLPAFDLTVTFTNHPPAAAGIIPAQRVAVGEAFAYAVPLSFFTDSDAQELLFTAALAGGSDLPAWLTFDPSGPSFSGTPGLTDAGTLFITVTVTDPYGAQAALTFSLTVESPDNRSPLLAQPIPDRFLTVGDSFTFTLPAGTFFDPDGDPLAYHAQLANGQFLPAWLALAGDSATFHGTPPETGVWTLWLTADDGRGGAVSTTFILTVSGDNLPPYLQILIPDQVASAGSPFTFTLDSHTFVDPNGEPFSLQAELADGSPLPDWLHFDPQTLTFSGVPPAGQSEVLLVRVFVLEGQLSIASATVLAGSDPASDLFLIAISAPGTTYLPADITGAQTTLDQAQVTLSVGQLPVHPHYTLKIETGAAGPPAPAGWVSLERNLRVSVVDASGSPVAGSGSASICFALTEVEWALGNGEARNFAAASAPSAAGSWRWLETAADAEQRTACAEVPFGLAGLFVPVQPEPDRAAQLPATGFAPERVTPLPAQAPEQVYTELGSLWLEIPRLGVQAEIVGVPYTENGAWDVTWLGRRVGWLESTAFPTWAGNSLLAAHAVDAGGRAGPFARLGELRYGDRIIVHLLGQRYIYEVRTVDALTAPDDTRALRHEERPWLTLVTCRGYDEGSGEYRWRTVVRAVQVKIEGN